MSRVIPRLARLRTRPSLSEYHEVETRLRSSHWELFDDSISAYPAKQLYATLQSIIDPTTRFMSTNMESLNKRFCKGKTVPYGYSMIYCNPVSGENELGFDGFDNYHAPCTADKDFFHRRMWVAGGFQFNPERPLKFGDEVSFTETVDKMRQYKRLEQIGVDYKREYKVDNVWSVIETRKLYYIQKTYTEERYHLVEDSEPDHTAVIVPSTVSIFRSSALMFNSHLVHYNPIYGSRYEDYPSIIVSGPLLVQLMLHFWQQHNPDAIALSLKYKIINPSFANERIDLCIGKTSKHRHRLWANSRDGDLCFVADLIIA
ncbi:hypothetical protein KL930_004397 [Ogataea haglerorum]|uniref:Uncharacterized protein n=1 Tax=Ogataea haglerorum TaxID=1937702 RepID=A0AAN6HZD6_9ASCO|nr:uncharacterized protein KL911_004751 [Ogataea haglerorum]KAG7692619.1 hypothetical protein KL915_004666 [Ogataea haglerorum]KAG7703870.1 hypothetical protein KL914_004361 [Ogataea haglerorum]KAG7715490.1 hypothetical protein KL913_003825 [Ogataea haglerorum]KAG7716012.1 hypothetical protein KL949_003907 [Ogataea haglerorum]KAG7725347.1 hypothetical protein KL933_004361 [Ogataea haglerorum]